MSMQVIPRLSTGVGRGQDELKVPHRLQAPIERTEEDLEGLLKILFSLDEESGLEQTKQMVDEEAVGGEGITE